MTDVRFTSEITVEPVAVCASDAMIARAARVSTLGERSAETGRPIERLIARLVSERHGSPFEHTFFSFRVHAPLYVMTEHLRHRAGWSYNGESGRYKVFEPVFYVPSTERGLTQVGKAMDYDIRPGSPVQQLATLTSIRDASAAAWRHYQYLLGLGIAREVARQVLPTNLMTTYYTSCNARSLMHFLSLRTRSERSQPLFEIEQVAHGYEDVFADAMPVTYQEFAKEGVAP